MQKITLLPNETLEINGVQINAEILKVIKNRQEQQQTRLSKGKIPDLYHSVFQPGPKPNKREYNETLLLLGNNLEYLDMILRLHKDFRDGLESLIEFRDEFIFLGAELQEVVFTDNYIETRPEVLKSIESMNIDIAGLKLEIEDEKANPSDISMAVRLYSRLGHL